LGKEIVNLFGYSIGQNNLEIKLVQEEQKAINAFFLNELTTLQAGNQPSEEFGASSQASSKKVFPFNPSLAEEIEKKSELIWLMIEEASKEKLLPNDLKNEKELEEKVKKNLTPLEKKDLLIAELQLKDKENKREKNSLFQGHASELEELKQENEQLKKSNRYLSEKLVPFHDEPLEEKRNFESFRPSPTIKRRKSLSSSIENLRIFNEKQRKFQEKLEETDKKAKENYKRLSIDIDELYQEKITEQK